MKNSNKQHVAGRLVTMFGALILVGALIYSARSNLVPTRNGNLMRSITLGVTGLFFMVAGAKMTAETER